MLCIKPKCVHASAAVIKPNAIAAGVFSSSPTDSWLTDMPKMTLSLRLIAAILIGLAVVASQAQDESALDAAQAIDQAEAIIEENEQEAFENGATSRRSNKVNAV